MSGTKIPHIRTKGCIVYNYVTQFLEFWGDLTNKIVFYMLSTFAFYQQGHMLTRSVEN